MKKILALILTITVVLTMMAVPVMAQEITYSGAQTAAISVAGDADVILDNVTYTAADNESALSVLSGNVTLKIVGSVELKGGKNGAGIYVAEGATLTITGEGTLVAAGNAGVDEKGSGAAGIGGSHENGNSGKIIIDGANVTAYGYGDHAAGIGSGWGGISDTIDIKNGANVTAYGGYYANGAGTQLQTSYGSGDPEGSAAIGGGSKTNKTIGNITISDSTVTAYGGSKGAGIGCGFWSSIGQIKITGSDITAYGGSSSAAIGTSRHGSLGVSANIIIENSTVNATGGEYGSAVGSGYNGDSLTAVPITSVEISGGDIVAVSGNGGAAIGGGYKSNRLDIEIAEDTNVLAVANPLEADGKKSVAQRYANAIGSGANGSGTFIGSDIKVEADTNITIITDEEGKDPIELNGIVQEGAQEGAVGAANTIETEVTVVEKAADEEVSTVAVVTTEKEITAAVYNSPAISTIVLGNDIYLTSRLTITRPLTLVGAGHALIANSSNWSTNNGKHLFGVNSDNVTVKNIILDCNKTGQGVNIYRAANVLFEDVTVKNHSSWNAVITVNGSQLTVDGLKYEDCSVFTAIEVANGKGVTEVPSLTAKGVLDIGNGKIIFGSGVTDYLAQSDFSEALNADGEPYYTAYKLNSAGKVTGYAQTISGITSNGGYKLITDVVLEKNITVSSGVEAVIDLNGNDLTVADGYSITSNGYLTVKDSAVGGSVSGVITPNASAVPKGFAPKVISEVGEIITVPAGAENVVEGNVQTVTCFLAEVDGVKYNRISDAIDAARNGGTVKFLTDMYMTDIITVNETDNLTLDLNGQTVETQIAENSNDKYIEFIVNNGALTIKDSSDSADGIIKHDTFSSGKKSALIVNNGALVVESGVLYDTTTAGDSADDTAIDNTSAGRVYVTGGSVLSAEGAAIVNDGGKVMITGGTFSSDVTEFLAQGYILDEVSTGRYKVSEPAESAKIEFKNPVEDDDNTIYDIVVIPADSSKYIINLVSAQMNIDLEKNGMALDMLIYGANGFNVTYDAATGKYLFNLPEGNNTTIGTKSGKEVVIGQVKVTGYTQKIDEAAKSATIKVTNAFYNWKEMYDSLAKVEVPIEDAEGDYTKTVASQTLTVNVNFPNGIKDNDAVYQDMKVVISGGDLSADKVFELGGSNALNDDTYTISCLLTENTAYMVEVSGAGYRTARYTVNIQETGKTLDFWNNVKDEAEAIEQGAASGAVTKNFLAGDIVKDNEINIYDLSAVVSYFASASNTANGFAKYDLNRDGVIDSKDVAYVLVSWGE